MTPTHLKNIGMGPPKGWKSKRNRWRKIFQLIRLIGKRSGR